MHIQRTDAKQNLHSGDLSELLQASTYTLLYFYPKDNTPGCTMEAIDFTDRVEEFSSFQVQVIGVSKDTHESHCSFQNKHNLTLPLISDSTGELHKQFGAWGEKNNYGKIVTGVIRSTFLLDQEGNTIKERKNIKATGHAERVLTYIKEELK